MRTEFDFEKKHGKAAVVELVKAKKYLTCVCDVCRRLRENHIHVVDDIVSTTLHMLFGPSCLSLEDAMAIVRSKGINQAENNNDQEGKEEIRCAEEGKNPTDTDSAEAA